MDNQTATTATSEPTWGNPTPPPAPNWHSTARNLLVYVEYAYLMRFAIIAVLVLVLLPVGYWAAPSIFTGLFDARGAYSFTFVVMIVFLLAWTVMVASRLVLVYGPGRFDLPRLQVNVVNTKIVFLFGLLGAPITAMCCHGSQDIGKWTKVLDIFSGFILSLMFLASAAWIHFSSEPTSGEDTAPKILPSFWLFKVSGSEERDSFWRRVDRFISKLPPDLRQGFVDGRGRLRSGFEMASLFFLFLCLLYWIFCLLFNPGWRSPENQPAALFYALFLAVILTWLLSGVAFLLDRFRIPVLTTLLAISLVNGLFHTDHEFTVTGLEKGKSSFDLSPTRVLQGWERGARNQGQSGKQLVVVATAGGGIQAAAWTTTVLTGIENACGASFDRKLLLVSAVSGGSVGAMYFLANYRPDGTFSANYRLDGTYDPFSRNPDTLNAIRFNASRSSLSAVGWGLLYPDLWRTAPLLGWLIPPTYDRGLAIENAWISGWKKPPDVSDWRQDVSNGKRPAVMFNATVAETGERFVAGTADVVDDCGAGSGRCGTVSFANEAKGFDMPVVTAARLSATFPYVSPIARQSQGPDRRRLFHIADGGYYDNSGVLGAVKWMRDAGNTLSSYHVLFILIDGASPAGGDGKSWAWQHQIYGPLETMVNVRTSSQRFRDHLDTDLIKDALAISKNPSQSVTVTPVTFAYPRRDAPLSWHLTGDQRKAVIDSWNEKVQPLQDPGYSDKTNPKREVNDFLGCLEWKVSEPSEWELPEQ